MIGSSNIRQKTQLKNQNSYHRKARISHEDHDWFYKNMVQISLEVIKEDISHARIKALRSRSFSFIWDWNTFQPHQIFFVQDKEGGNINSNFIFSWEELTAWNLALWQNNSIVTKWKRAKLFNISQVGFYCGQPHLIDCEIFAQFLGVQLYITCVT